jgi:hypothetical protein
VIGTGLPRTGTASLKRALEYLLGGPCHHMSTVPGHPFDLGPDWDRALDGGASQVDWAQAFEGYVAPVDWPASQFWPELAAAYPDATILLSERDSPRLWWESMDQTVLKVARKIQAPGWDQGRDLVRLLECLTGTSDWDHPELLEKAYTAHSSLVRQNIDPTRVLTWKPGDGWEPLCRTLDLEPPNEPFPWLNTRSQWG